MSNLIVGQYTKNIGGIIIYQTPRSISDNIFPKIDLFLENTLGKTGNNKSVYYDLEGVAHFNDADYFMFAKIVNINDDSLIQYKRIMALYQLYIYGNTEETIMASKMANKIAKEIFGFQAHQYSKKGVPVSMNKFYHKKYMCDKPLMDKSIILDKIIEHAKDIKACIFNFNEVDVELFAIKFKVIDPGQIMFKEKYKHLFRGLNFTGRESIVKVEVLAECISYNKDLFDLCKSWLIKT